MNQKVNKMKTKKYKKTKIKPLVTSLDPLIYNKKVFTQKVILTS